MSDNDKFRICPKVFGAIKRSPITFAQVYEAAHKSQSMWRRVTGQAKDSERTPGVVLDTYLAFCDAINQLMPWVKSPEAMCHPDDRERLLIALSQINGESDISALDESSTIELPLPVQEHADEVADNDEKGITLAPRSGEASFLASFSVKRLRLYAIVAACAVMLAGASSFSLLPLRQKDKANVASEKMEQIVQDIPLIDAVVGSNKPAEQASSDVLAQILSTSSTATVEELHISHRDWLKLASKEKPTQLGGQPLLEADAHMAFGNSLYTFMEPSHAVEEFEKAVAIRQTQFGPDHAKTMESEFLLAQAYVTTGKLTLAKSVARRALENQRRVLGDDALETLRTVNLLAKTYAAMQQHAEAVLLFEEVVDSGKRQKLDDMMIHEATCSLAASYLHLEQKDQAIYLVIKSLLKQQALLGEKHPNTLVIQQNLGQIYLSTGATELAEQTFSRTRDALLASLGASHVQTIEATRLLAMASCKLERFEVAESLYLEAIRGQQLLYGDSPDRDLMTLCFYARLLRDTNRPSEAEAIVRYVVDQQSSQFGDGYLATVSSLRSMASIYRVQGRFERELIWQMRTLIARYRVHGYAAKATRDAWREFAQTIGNCYLQFSSHGWLGYGEKLVRELRLDRSLPEGVPVVEKDHASDRLVLSWKANAEVESPSSQMGTYHKPIHEASKKSS